MVTESEKEKKKGGRSSSYPAFSLEDCIAAVKKVKEELGSNPSSRDLVARAMGYSGVTGASATKISACVHFGLLDRSGNTYSTSELSSKILTPVSNGEKAEALVEAVNSPSLYSKLISEYSGKALPNMLENILSRQYDIIDNSAQRAAEIFKKSLEYAGLLRNGVVQKTLQPEDNTVINNQIVDNNIIASSSATNFAEAKPATATTDDKYFEIILSDTSTKLLIPKEFSYEVSIGGLANEIKALNQKMQELKRQHGVVKNETAD